MDLLRGQFAALVLALLFLFAERYHLRAWARAALEAFRFWGFMAISVLTVWYAVRIDDPAQRTALALLSPIIAAILINNIYSKLHRRLGGA